MHILDFYKHITLTPDQENAVLALADFVKNENDIFILQGVAGSGKTTLLKGFTAYLKALTMSPNLMAPTGRAAKVMRQNTGEEASTIHRAIYRYKHLHDIQLGDDESTLTYHFRFDLEEGITKTNEIYIIDESSMVSDVESKDEFFQFGSGRLLKDLIDFTCVANKKLATKIIFVGDTSQLPPIGMEISPAMDPFYLESNFQLKVQQCFLSQVKRQSADTGILRVANMIRQGIRSNCFNILNLKDNGEDLRTVVEERVMDHYQRQQGSKIMICATNKSAQIMNAKIRERKYAKECPIRTSDVVVICANNGRANVFNGDFAVVNEVSDERIERNIPLRIKDGKTTNVHLVWRKMTLLLVDDEDRVVEQYVLENYLYGEGNLSALERRALYVDFIIRYSQLKRGSDEFKQALKDDAFFNALLIRYGYAITCHKAQGGEWDNVYIYWETLQGNIAALGALQGWEDLIYPISDGLILLLRVPKRTFLV